MGRKKKRRSAMSRDNMAYLLTKNVPTSWVESEARAVTPVNSADHGPEGGGDEHRQQLAQDGQDTVTEDRGPPNFDSAAQPCISATKISRDAGDKSNHVLPDTTSQSSEDRPKSKDTTPLATMAAPEGYRIWDMNQLQELINLHCVCKVCNSGHLQFVENPEARKGWACDMTLVCSDTECPSRTDTKWTSTSQTQVDGFARRKDINIRCVIAMRAMGKGRAGAAVFSSYMDMPQPIHPNSWHIHTRSLSDSAHEQLQEEFSR